MIAVSVVGAVPPRRPPLIAQHWELLLRCHLHLRPTGKMQCKELELAAAVRGTQLHSSTAAVQAAAGMLYRQRSPAALAACRQLLHP